MPFSATWMDLEIIILSGVSRTAKTKTTCENTGIYIINQKEKCEYPKRIKVMNEYPEKTIIQKDTCTPMFIAALFTIARSWKQPKCPSTDEWIKKMWCIHTMEYYSAISWVIC